MTRLLKIGLPLVLIFALSAHAGAQTGRCRGTDVYNCFSLRAPANLIPTIAQRHELVVVENLNSYNPEVVLVSGPSAKSPESTLSHVGSDPDVLGFETLSLHSIDEAALGSLVDGTGAVVASITLDGEYTGSEAQHFLASVWDGYMNQPAAVLVRLPETRSLGKSEALGFGTVAIIDTGVDADHPLLQGALVPGYDFILDQAGIASEWEAIDPVLNPSTKGNLEAVADQSFTSILEGGGDAFVMNDSTQAIVDQSFTSILEGETLPAAFGHGTMVAGIIRLVAPGAKIMPLRVFDGDGKANSFDTIQAIYYAVDHGANVINMSFSMSSFSIELSRAVQYAESQGVVCVSSAGNSGRAAQSWPAAFEKVLGVASTDLNDNLSSFSNYGPYLAVLAAPGERLITLYPGGNYAIAWGTSFSAAMVSGAASLLNEEGAPDLFVDYQAAEEAFESSSVDIVINQDAGSGRLDTYSVFGAGLVGY